MPNSYRRVHKEALRMQQRVGYRVTDPTRKAIREIRGSRSDLRPILIYTMEKVGTQSVLATLRASSPAQRVYMTHTVAGSTSRQASRSVPFDLDAFLEKSTPNPGAIVTGVRDPVARDISLFFEILPSIVPEVRLDRCNGDELEEHFNRFIANETAAAYLTPDEWFRTEFGPALGRDVLSMLNSNPGPLRLDVDRFDVVLLRVESLNNDLLPALSELTGRPFQRIADFNMARSKGSDPLKPHYRWYKEFTASVELSDDYLDRSYSDPVIELLYSEVQRKEFRTRWESR